MKINQNLEMMEQVEKAEKFETIDFSVASVGTSKILKTKFAHIRLYDNYLLLSYSVLRSYDYDGTNITEPEFVKFILRKSDFIEISIESISNANECDYRWSVNLDCHLLCYENFQDCDIVFEKIKKWYTK